MPKIKKRKSPIASSAPRSTSVAAQSCRDTIRKFHVLMKRRQQLETNDAGIAGHATSVAEIDQQLSKLGGLERYQQLSALGQREERGGGSEKIFIQWIKELGVHRTTHEEGKGKLRLLEVGALKPDNYSSCSTWIDCTPMDLRSRHPQIIEQDFLSMDLKEQSNKWNAISLSLVLNFVPSPSDRGRMLESAHSMLISDGLLFLALPLPCVANSRYLTFPHLKAIMESLGFLEIREKWRKNGKMGYWLYQKAPVPSNQSIDAFKKKTVLRTGHRNNFAVILDTVTTAKTAKLKGS